MTALAGQRTTTARPAATIKVGIRATVCSGGRAVEADHAPENNGFAQTVSKAEDIHLSSTYVASYYRAGEMDDRHRQPVIRSGGGANAVGRRGVITIPTPSNEHLRGLLAQTERDLAEAEQRREHQARVVAGLHEGTETRAAAERVLREIDGTIAFICANRQLIQDILD
ncbi:hypothetical protein MKK84_30890 [Methylobacterium sp. E-065]|uniref:hypothetical protein n=1 Tax=Methylobacterium sp. E-065 TaxID=2836583 RepID=UPI001FB9D4DC|nr:hypothetical protein [Methylobacterium sp. E-065]MCJ2021768.1 hypothetical protein [Methylobacterium sp. E-065]